MRILPLALVILPALLLSACGGGTPPAPASSSEASLAPAPQTNPPAPAVPVATGKPAKDADLKPLFGDWGLDPANCGDQVLKISKTRFEGPGSGCDITGFSDNGDGTYTAVMSCTANGQAANESVRMRPIFAPSGEGIDLLYLNRNNLASEVLRCAAN